MSAFTDRGRATRNVELLLLGESQVAPEQKSAMLWLQMACFAGQVTAQEWEEDFDRPAVARLLAYHGVELVGCAEIFAREVAYAGQAIRIGRMSPCTREDWRGQGIGTRLYRAAMDYLRRQRGDTAFLSVDTKRITHPLYERLGFRMLPRPFRYVNARGEWEEGDGEVRLAGGRDALGAAHAWRCLNTLPGRAPVCLA
jgi:GNAT superfamily N-acetyltransferase